MFTPQAERFSLLLLFWCGTSGRTVAVTRSIGQEVVCQGYSVVHGNRIQTQSEFWCSLLCSSVCKPLGAGLWEKPQEDLASCCDSWLINDTVLLLKYYWALEVLGWCAWLCPWLPNTHILRNIVQVLSRVLGLSPTQYQELGEQPGLSVKELGRENVRLHLTV